MISSTTSHNTYYTYWAGCVFFLRLNTYLYTYIYKWNICSKYEYFQYYIVTVVAILKIHIHKVNVSISQNLIHKILNFKINIKDYL